MVLQVLEQAGLGPSGPGFWFLLALVFAGAFLVVHAFRLSRERKAATDALDRARRELAELGHIKDAVATTDRIIRDETARMRTEAETRGEALREKIHQGMEGTRAALDARLVAFSEAQSNSMNERMSLFTEALKSRQGAFEKSIAEKLTVMTDSIVAMTRGNSDAHVQLRQTVEQRLDKLRTENDAKLEQMRATVDEKLQTTLEKRLGESFKHVSERLEQVHKGLGEMQTLAIGVGDLKKVLTNVKDRGGWAEVQLGSLLDQMLAREQYIANARIDPESQEVVEFAVRLPGADGDGEVLLPIDAKFPKEDYERLVSAWDSADGEAARGALDALEKVIEFEAKKISDKYIRPPRTTDFAILFLPTEGLFAEAIRRDGLAAKLQSKYRVTIAGPTTLAALLTSLQMGFRTLAIQKRSGEVWRVLAEAKSEFKKYGDVWERIGKQLRTVQNTVDAAGTRTRAVERKLRDVETLDAISADEPLAALDFEDGEDEKSEDGEPEAAE